ncbi:hypothetical protein [Micromonospora chersina]|uniref:hypothetical protein n=1 Tax=Micromonospora chersina TaxID=47854 RepID=UPI003F4CE962
MRLRPAADARPDPRAATSPATARHRVHQAAQNHNTAGFPARLLPAKVPPSIVRAVNESACGTAAASVPPLAVGAAAAEGVD